MTNVSSEPILAFVPQWEYQCCGDPLEVGTTRELTLTPRSDDWVFGGPPGEPVTRTVEHHTVDVESRHVRARIDRMWETRCHHVLRDGSYFPDVDTYEFAPITRLERWDDAWLPPRHGGEPVGWVVELVVLAELPDRDYLYGQDA